MGRGRCASVLLKCMGMYPANQGVLCGLLPCPLDIRLSYSRTAGHTAWSSKQTNHTRAPPYILQSCLSISQTAHQYISSVVRSLIVEFHPRVTEQQ